MCGDIPLQFKCAMRSVDWCGSGGHNSEPHHGVWGAMGVCVVGSL